MEGACLPGRRKAPAVQHLRQANPSSSESLSIAFDSAPAPTRAASAQEFLMTNRFRSLMIAAGLAAAVFGMPAAAQKGYTAPRTPDGKPDLQGIWEIAKSPDKDLESSKLIVEPANHKIPYKPEALAQKKTNAKTSAANDPLNKCFMPGIPRINLLNYPFQIFQTPDFTAIAYEYIHNYRTVYMKRDKHLEDIDFWGGDSIGHWDGDTLVVDVADFNDQTWFDKAGNYHS